MPTPIVIQALEFADIAHIHALQPPDWTDVPSRFREHFGQPYYHPVKVTAGEELIGVGQIFSFANTAWLGNIIVREGWRGQGIGRKLTVYLMELAISFNHSNLYLLATAQGEPLYQKLGFKIQSTYLFYTKNSDLQRNSALSPAIHRADPRHFELIYALDARATGENRRTLLERYLPDAWVYEDEHQPSLQGFYLPRLGEGLVIATDFNAGIALLHCRAQSPIVVPADHTFLCDYLSSQGYTSNRTAFLMFFGNPKKWRPDMIYSRIGGYAG